MASTPPALRFDIDAAVVFRLGEELITDVVQALVELVKNSYDADATWVKVTIDTQGRNKWGRHYSNAKGTIVVQDNGFGMDQHAIEHGWLSIAKSPKRDDKAVGRITPLGRTPIGDKGLGRLGSQRLANNVEMITRAMAEPTTEQYVGFSWDDFRGSAKLGEVGVYSEQGSVTGTTHGTKLILSDLCEPEAWRGEANLRELQRQVSLLISPFQEQKASQFEVALEVDGKRIEISEIAQRIRETAFLRYAFRFDGECFQMSGVARLNYLQPSRKDDQRLFRSLCRRDGGEALYQFLASKAKGRRPSPLKLSDRPGWFAEFGKERNLEDLGGVRRVDKSVANPGPFHGEVDAVSLASSDLKKIDVFKRQSDYRRLVRDLAGIRVYRDGFGVRVGGDWLGLGKQWTGGTSYYGLRPGNVLGYVAISARENAVLTETTSREGFQVTPHYQNFVDLLAEFVRFAGDAQEYLRRGVLQFLAEHRDRDVGVEPEDPHTKITERIDRIAGTLASEKSKVQNQAASLRALATTASKTLRRVQERVDRESPDRDVPGIPKDLEEQLELASVQAAKAEKVLNEVTVVLEGASELQAMRDVLDRRWEMLKDEVSALYQSVSLGLTAEVLAHEIHNIADGLARRSSALLRQMNRGVRKRTIVTYIEHVRSSIAAMRKQLGHLTPSLRYLRERRERIELLRWAEEFAAFHNDNLDRDGIQVLVSGTDATGFAVTMNRGKLTQIFDNLIHNAAYWLREAIRAGLLEKGEITIAVDPPVVLVMDNGRGVEESVEESLFDPFVTTKRSGRGLGLFVVHQLLDSESCGVMLLPDRNVNGRRYVFELDLSGATDD